MKSHYNVFCFFDLKPVYFYLLLNFLDLMYNNFNLSVTLLEKSNKDYLSIELIILSIVNNLNRLMVIVAIACYFVYIYFQNYRTYLHQGYVTLRFVICFCRAIIYFFTFFFYSLILLDDMDILGVYFNLFFSFALMYLEINNIIWCFWLKDIIRFKKVKKEVIERKTLFN